MPVVEMIADLIGTNTDDPYHPYVTVKFKPVFVDYPNVTHTKKEYECAMSALRRYFTEHVSNAMKVIPYNSALAPGSVTDFDFYRTEYEDGVEVDYVDISFTYPGGNDPSNTEFMFVVDAFSSSPAPEDTSCFESMGTNFFEFYPFFIPFQPPSSLKKIEISSHDVYDVNCNGTCTTSIRLGITSIDYGRIDLMVNGQVWDIPMAEPHEGWVDTWYTLDAVVSIRIWNYDYKTKVRGPLSDPYIFVNAFPFTLHLVGDGFEIWFDDEYKGITPLSFKTDTSYHHISVKKHGSDEYYCQCHNCGFDPVVLPTGKISIDEIEGDCVFAFTTLDSDINDITLRIGTPICSYIEHGYLDKENVSASDISDLILAYLGAKDIGFVPTASEIAGVVLYYLGMIESGDKLTGCE